jgi:hypothetical protein
MNKNLYNEIINGAIEFEDGETGMLQCIELYCEENGISPDTAEMVQDLWFETEAVNNGIPRDVARCKAKLTDFFSREYIDFKTNKK